MKYKQLTLEEHTRIGHALNIIRHGLEYQLGDKVFLKFSKTKVEAGRAAEAMWRRACNADIQLRGELDDIMWQHHKTTAPFPGPYYTTVSHPLTGSAADYTADLYERLQRDVADVIRGRVTARIFRLYVKLESPLSGLKQTLRYVETRRMQKAGGA